MLSIGKIALGQHRYYEQQVAGGADDYYSGRGEAPGEWIGAGAEALGLSGRVAADQFSALLAGNDPRQAEHRLRSSERDPKIAAFDLTFSAPKSVSVLFAIAPERYSRELVACHEDAVAAALGYLEDTAVMVRRGHAGCQIEAAEGLIAAAYRHRMSRALDPQLHTHVVAANLARGGDGRFTSLHSSLLYASAKTAGTLYQAHLRALVTERLGLEWGETHKGAAELLQIAVTVLKHFSRRRAEMEREAAAGGIGLASKGAAESVALATRDRKRYGVDSHTWRQEMRARAAEHGLDAAEVQRVIETGLDRIQARLLRRNTVDEHVIGDQLAGATGLTERANTFEEGLVLQGFASAAREGALVGEVRAQGTRFARRPDVLQVESGAMTTAELVSCEQRLIVAAVGRAGEGTAVLTGSADHLASSIRRPLSDEQRNAIRAVTGSGDGVSVIQALAGVGKTYTAGALREAYEAGGYEVLGVAPTGRAARELAEQAAVPSRTIDRLLIDTRRPGGELPAGCVLILDEAGMAPTRLSATLLEQAQEAQAKVIAIGDPGQLASVQAGGWLAAIGERIGAVALCQVIRQRDHAERRALAELHDRRPENYLEWAEANQRIQIFQTPYQAREWALRAWVHRTEQGGPAETVLIARDNEMRDALNRDARTQRRAAGDLGEESSYGAVELAVGDRVICRRNDLGVDVDNGMRGSVRELNPDGVKIATDAGALRWLPASYVAEHVEHAYALTGHGTQGTTVENAIVLASPHDLTAGWSYTALSRAREHTNLLIYDDREHDRSEFAPADRLEAPRREELLGRVARRMLERDDEDLAVDQLPEQLAHEPRSASEQGDRADLIGDATSRGRHESPGSRLSTDQRFETAERLRAELAVLPTLKLQRREDLEARVLVLLMQREQTAQQLAQLPQPRRRFGREHDPCAVERALLSSAMHAVEHELERLRTQHASIEAEIGDPAHLEQERQRLQSALARLAREQPEPDRERRGAQREHEASIEIGL